MMEANPITAPARTSIGPVQIGIIVLGVATALIHFSLMLMMGKFSLLFTLNGLGYLCLVAALFLPLPFLRSYRSIIRIVFILYTLLTIFLWVVMGTRDIVGYTDKLIEVALVVLLWLDRARG
jgi:hypothetical protein